MPNSHRLMRAFAAFYRRRGQRRHLGTVAQALAAARATTRRKQFCLMLTRAGDGTTDARVMQPSKPDADFTVWLGTAPSSRKMAQLQADARMSLVYEDDRKTACIVLKGRAHIVDDAAECERRFIPLWWAFWPAGPREDFVLVRFETDAIEVLDFSRRVTPEPFGRQAARLARGPDGAWILAADAAPAGSHVGA